MSPLSKGNKCMHSKSDMTRSYLQRYYLGDLLIEDLGTYYFKNKPLSKDNYE